VGLAEQVELLRAENTELRAKVAELTAKLEALEIQLEKLRREGERNSGNSGKPPSSDTLAERERQAEERLSRAERRRLAREKILSPSFFKKSWPRWELDGLTGREISGRRIVVLPVWHKVDRQDVERYSPTLASKLAARTADGIDAVAGQIARRCKTA
jgi:hypothetical protein